MTIVSAETKPCVQRQSDAGWTFARARRSGHPRLDHRPDRRRRARRARLRPRAADGHGAIPRAPRRRSISCLPRLIGRDGADIAAIMEEVDIALALAPAAKAAIDMALHDLLARRLGVPVNVLFGGEMRDAIPQARIVPMKAPTEMADLAGEARGRRLSDDEAQTLGRRRPRHARIAAVRERRRAEDDPDPRPQPVVFRQGLHPRLRPHRSLRHRPGRAAGAGRRLAGPRALHPHPAGRDRGRRERAARLPTCRARQRAHVRRDQPEGHQPRRHPQDAQGRRSAKPTTSAAASAPPSGRPCCRRCPPRPRRRSPASTTPANSRNTCTSRTTRSRRCRSKTAR